MNINDLYKTVSDRIIRELEAGTPVWLKPWKNGKRNGGIMPINGATKRPYSGVNIILLWSEREEHGYPTPFWMTFKQALDKGAWVRKGERGTPIIFTKKVSIMEDDEERQVPILKSYVVFNESKIDGLPPDVAEPAKIVVEPLRAAEWFIAATNADIRYDGNQPMYVPSKDFIVMPPREAFTSKEGYYATLLHEAGHWSGHEKRLNRDLKNRFGSNAYAAEELIAEITSAFLCAHLGITGELRHASYIQNWITLLKEDDRAFFTAASQASKAADFLRAFSNPTEQSDE